MPELPEVENICRNLANQIIGTTINNIIIKRYNLRIDIPQDFAICFTGKKITNVTRKAKYILINTNNNDNIVIHLGMSGKIFTHNANDEWQKHEHVRFYLDNGIILRYVDVRRFGLISYGNTILSKNKGIEPSYVTTDYYLQKSQKKKQSIKNFLMDQNIVFGIGNIYASEILFLAQISPTRSLSTITKTEWQKIITSTNTILTKAIELGGSTIKDFADTSGKSGNFQNYLQVYGKAGSTCNICDNIISKIKQAGRSTFFCPNCQK